MSALGSESNTPTTAPTQPATASIPARTSAPTPPHTVGVIGGGRMGAGIGHAFLLAGSRVHVIERDTQAVDAAATRLHALLAASAARDALPRPRRELDAALTLGTDFHALASSELVVEAVPEDARLKAEALGRAEASTRPDAVIASNTSSISIDELAAVLDRPQRFIGMHFFNPVPASTLVEIVRGAASEETTVGAAQDWVTALGKTAITVRDSPGFASSRLGLALGLEAMRMLEEGVASAADIDAAMTLGYKHPVGPLRLSDIVGLDVRLGIADYLHSRLGERFAAPALLRRLVAEGDLGRKSGRGFYTWNEEGAPQ